MGVSAWIERARSFGTADAGNAHADAEAFGERPDPDERSSRARREPSPPPPQIVDANEPSGALSSGRVTHP